MSDKIKELENYLDDLTNLIDTGWFLPDPVKDCVFHHKGMTLTEFVSQGREYIRQYLIKTKHPDRPDNLL